MTDREAYKIACSGILALMKPIAFDANVALRDPNAPLMAKRRLEQYQKYAEASKIMEERDEEVDRILDLGVECHFGQPVESMGWLVKQGFDAVFVGSGAPRGRDLDIPGRQEASDNIHIGIDWLGSVAFGHTDRIGKRVVVIGGGNTAMDCCRTALRLGGEQVTVTVRSGFDEMKASPWEKEDAMHEGIPILDYHAPKSFELENGRLTGVWFQKMRAELDERGRRKLVPTGEA